MTTATQCAGLLTLLALTATIAFLADDSGRGNRPRLSRVLLRADQGGQLGRPKGLLRRLACHSQGLVTSAISALRE
jgi:hypothetical protein